MVILTEVKTWLVSFNDRYEREGFQVVATEQNETRGGVAILTYAHEVQQKAIERIGNTCIVT